MFAKPQPKPASSPLGQLLGLAVIAALLFVGANPSAPPVSLSIHDVLGGGIAVISASIYSSSPFLSSSSKEPKSFLVSHQTDDFSFTDEQKRIEKEKTRNAKTSVGAEVLGRSVARA